MRPEFDSFTEPKTSRRKFMLGLLFCSAAGVAAIRQPSKTLNLRDNQKLEDLIPKTIGRWKFVAASGLVVPPEDQLVRATYSQLLTRVYSDDSAPPIMLLLAHSDSQTGFLQIHRPETCYTASGYSILNIDRHVIPVANKPLITNNMEAVSAGGQTEHVVYWTRVGDRIPENWRQQRIAVAMDNIKGLVPDALLARVSVVSPDRATALRQLDEFVQAMIGSVPSGMRRIFTA